MAFTGNQAIIVEISLNPYQGLKLGVRSAAKLIANLAIVEISLNPYQGLKLLILGMPSYRAITLVEISLNPYQGLKHLAPLVVTDTDPLKFHLIPIRD